MRTAACLLAFAATAQLTTSAAPQSKKGWHEDSRYGYKLRPPKEWGEIPMRQTEGWQIAKWLSDRGYFFTDPEQGWTWEHKPEVKVIAFVTEVVREKARIKTEKDEEDEITKVLILNPYRDYQDYLERTYSGGGWYVDDEEEAEINEVPCTQYSIKVEKLTRTGPKRIVTWVFHTPEVDFAVQFEVLEDSYDKLKRTIERTLKSFELIPRTEAGLPTAATGEGTGFVIEVGEKEKSLTPKERAERRKQLEISAREKAKNGAPDGWEVLEIDGFLVLNHSNKRAPKQKVEQAKAVLAWLEKTFPFIGPDEYAPKPIIRICKDWEEESSFRSGQWWGMDIEIVTHNDFSGKLGFETEWLNRRILDYWLIQKDRDLKYAMPQWLNSGLAGVLGSATNKRGKIDFRMDDYERDGLRQRAREEKLLPLRDLLRQTPADLMKSLQAGDWGVQHESDGLVRFLITGEGAKNRATRDVIPEYIKNLKVVITKIAEEKAEKEPDAPKVPQTEEEEEEFFRQRQQGWKAAENRVLEETFQRTFGDWTEKDWEKFEKVYVKSIS